MNKKFLEEIMQQPEVLHKLANNYPINDSFLPSINKRISSGEITNVVLTGMGASLASCYPLWLSLSKHGIYATIWDTSELVYYGNNILTPKTLVIAVSQSGESIEIKHLVEQRNKLEYLVGITNNSNSTLGNKANVTINLHAGKEETVSTKTYTSSLAALHLLGTQIISSDVSTQKDAIHSLADLLKEYMNPLKEKLFDLASFFGKTSQIVVLGRGFSIASVQTASLILKEASKIFAFGLSSGQFRHGPMEIVKSGLKAILFMGSKSTQGINHNLAVDLNNKLCKISVVSQFPLDIPSNNIQHLLIPQINEKLLPILEIIPIQFLTIPLADFLGYTAGDFINCDKVTLIE